MEEWTAKLMPPGGRVLHAETRDGHHLIACQMPGSKLRLSVVHAPHPLARFHAAAGLVRLGGVENGIEPDFPQSPTTAEVEHIDFSIAPEFSGDIEVIAWEHIQTYWNDEPPLPQDAILFGSFVVPWP